MFLVETGVLVIISVLVSFLLIFNARGLIEDLLSVRLSSLHSADCHHGTDWLCER